MFQKRRYMNIALVGISFAIFIAYVVYAVITMQKTEYKIPHSISQTYYYVPWKNGMSTSYFIMCIMVLPALIGMNPWFEWAKVFGFISLACLIGVAGAPDYWNEKETAIHCTFTYTCEACIVPYIVLATNYWWVTPIYAVAFLLPCFITKTWKDCRSFWLELIAFFSFYTSTLLQVINY